MSTTVQEALSSSPWADQARPTNAEGWLQRAAEVAGILAVDAVERDRAQHVPTAEVQLLKDSGLVTLLGPVEHGGAGLTWARATANKVGLDVRTNAAASVRVPRARPVSILT